MTLDSSAASSRQSAGRIVAIDVVITVALLGALELAARGLIRLLRGRATTGLHGRTLYLDYEPFVMYGPGWDARFSSDHQAAACRRCCCSGDPTAQGLEAGPLKRRWPHGSTEQCES